MTDRPYKIIGDRLAKLRADKGFDSASDCAAAYGWPKSTYAAHEYGTRKPRPETMAIYARRFGVTPFWLEFGVEAGNPDCLISIPTTSRISKTSASSRRVNCWPSREAEAHHE